MYVICSRSRYNSRAQEPWRSYSGMFWSGGLSKEDATDIVQYVPTIYTHCHTIQGFYWTFY